MENMLIFVIIAW